MLKDKDMYKIRIKPLVFLFMLLLSFSFVSADFTNGQVNYYNFTSNAIDYRGNQNLGGASPPTYSSDGAYFNGAEFLAGARNQLYNNHDFTICFQIKPTVLDETKIIWDNHDNANNGVIARIVDSSGYKYNLWHEGTASVVDNILSVDTLYKICTSYNETSEDFKNYFDSNSSVNVDNKIIDPQNSGYLFTVGKYAHADSGYFKGYIKEMCIWNQELGLARITEYMNHGCLGYTPPIPPPDSDPFKIYAYNSIRETQILKFNATISGLNTYSTTNGTLNTPLLQNDTGTYNITIKAPSYFSRTYNAYSPANNINASLTPIGILNLSFANYTTITGTNYTRELIYNFNYICDTGSTTYLKRYINSTLNHTKSLTCTNTTATASESFRYDKEGKYLLTLEFDTDIGVTTNAKTNNLFISDLFNPTITGFTFEISEGFLTPLAYINFTCTDNIISTLTYYSYLNGALIDEETHPSGTVHSNRTTALINGNNNATVKCSDGFGITSSSNIKNVLLRTLFLIDEQDNTAFNLPNATSLIAYIDDNRTSFNFKAQGTSNISFIATANVKLRFEIIYSDGIIILRYVDTGLTEDNIRVCVNKDGVTHYEQILTSSSVRPVILNSVYADCMVAADYTRFAYQNAKILKAYTYNNLYYLYTFENNDPDDTQIFLASVDGSLATYINLDTLEFLERGYDITTIGDAVAISKRNANEMNILYYNVLQNNDALRVAITNAATGQVYLNSTSFSDVNEANIIFNFATLNTNATTLFKIYVTKTINGQDNTILKYFTSEGITGSVNSSLIFIVSIFLLVFGLSFTVTQRAFAWFGIIIILANLGLLSYAIGAWYITFSMAVNAIILVYIFLVMNAKNSMEIG